MTRFDVEAIRAAHPIVETVAGAGVQLHRAGRRLVARCPFHEEAKASFTVYDDTQSWYCFGCGRGGDLFDFVGGLNGTTFRETAAALSQGVGALPANVTPLRGRREPRRLTAEELAVVDATVAFYERTLTTYPDVRRYLVDERAISLETARSCRLGYAGSGLTEHLRQGGFDLELAAGIGLLHDGRERFVGRVILPDLDRDGRATWFTGRAVHPRARLRYLDIEAPSPLLGLAQVRGGGHHAVVVVEGSLDRLTGIEWDIPTLALNGSHATDAMLADLATFREVYLALDTNRAGREAAERLEGQLGDRAVRVMLPPGAVDLNVLGQMDGGRTAFLRLIVAARGRLHARWASTAAVSRAA